MAWTSLDIPDDPSTLADWVERQLMSRRLATVVAELFAVHGTTPGPPLTELLGSDATAVLQTGVRAIPAPVLRQLLRHPERLLDLQEWVLREGGTYWDRVHGG